MTCSEIAYLLPESVTSLHYIAQALDSTAVRKIPAEPTGAAGIFKFHCRTNILHSVFTLKSRIQVLAIYHLYKGAYFNIDQRLSAQCLAVALI
ncbi:MAG: hypothetical protein OFPII_27550 [Osedax symbiont Rs1]|nr:MAG: hypothetical protein OFPII_27550 [Osedax symbiont Rs1]